MGSLLFVIAQASEGGAAGGSGFVAGILSGVAVTLLSGILVFAYRKVTLERALVASLGLRQTRLREFRDFVTDLRPHVTEGKVPGWGMRVTPDPSDIFDDLRGEIYKYYSASNAIRLIQFYFTFNRIEILLQGLGEDLTRLRKDETVVDGEMNDHLHARMDRIVAMIDDCLVAELKRVRDLPLELPSDSSPSKVLRSTRSTELP